MVLLLNLLFAVLAVFGADYVLARLGVSDPIKVVVAVILGIIVFLANFGAQVK